LTNELLQDSYLTRNVSHPSGIIALGSLKLIIDWHSVTICISLVLLFLFLFFLFKVFCRHASTAISTLSCMTWLQSLKKLRVSDVLKTNQGDKISKFNQCSFSLATERRNSAVISLSQRTAILSYFPVTVSTRATLC